MGLRFSMPRKTSGALLLPREPPSVVAQASKYLWGQVETFSLDRFEQMKSSLNPKELVKSDRFKSVQLAQTAKEQLQKAPTQLQAQLQQLNAQTRAQDLQKRLQALGQKRSDPMGALQAV